MISVQLFFLLSILQTMCDAYHLPLIGREAIFRRAAAAATKTVTETVTESAPVAACPTSVSQSSNPTATPTKTTPGSASSSPTSSGGVTKSGCFWIVPEVGSFANMATYNFGGSSLPAGLQASDYTVQDRQGDSSIPYNHVFKPANVGVSGGYLNLKVPGGQKPSSKVPISCAEVQTTYQVQYASVRTRAIFSKVKGTCHGTFFYDSDTQESDIEYLTDPSSLSNNGPSNPIPIWYSNQAVEAGTEATQDSINPPSDPTSGIHEYRIDWTPTYTAYFFDGVEQTRFYDNVPSSASYWVMNNWANGDPGWSVGPPSSDNILKIQSVTMYYNTTTDSC